MYTIYDFNSNLFEYKCKHTFQIISLYIIFSRVGPEINENHIIKTQ